MTYRVPAPRAAHHAHLLGASTSPVMPTLGITVFGCAPDEAVAFRELAPRLGVAPTITAAAVSEASAGLASGNCCISVGHKTRVTASTLRALAQVGVRYISTRSIGCDHIDAAHARRVGIEVGNVAYSPASVADYTVMLMLMALRRMKATMRRVEAHDFRLDDVRGYELRDMTVGMVGTGRIGGAVIERLSGFGCRILAHDHHPKTVATYVPLDDLLQQSDIVTLHTPLNAATHHLLDRPRIARLKPGAFVINTGRGGLLDTVALIEALERGQLGGAALDVLEGEEGIFYADCRNTSIATSLLARLAALPNVLITPHTAYYTDHALRDTVEQSLRNCLAFAAAANRS